MDLLAKEYRELIEKELKEQIDSVNFVTPLSDAVQYVMFPGGKRIRPLFAAMLARDLGGDVKEVIKVAVTVEYIHAASLIHDDLPAMDDDDMRRGKPSCHCAFSEATAILCADTLMVLPFEIISKNAVLSGFSQKTSGYLAQAFRELCNGQQLDLLGGQDLDVVYQGKTGALFAASAKIAALLAKKNEKEIEIAGELGSELGVYFQIVDDFIDAKGIKGRGKKSSDERNNKQTFMTQDTTPEKCEKLSLSKGKIEDLLHKLGAKNQKQEKDFIGVHYIIDQVERALKAN